MVSRRPHRPRPHSPESPVVRQYRFLLRNAAPEALEAAHADVLARLPQEQCRTILAAVREALLAGQRLGPRDSSKIARLIVLGERRTPNAFLAACEDTTLGALARGVVAAPDLQVLLTRYEEWDGADPERPEDTSDAGFNPQAHQHHPLDDLRVTGGGYGP